MCVVFVGDGVKTSAMIALSTGKEYGRKEVNSMKVYITNDGTSP
jgi:hypothetical protein